MEKKQIDVECPCCEARLAVDVLTEKVLRATPRAELDETGQRSLDAGRWDEASERVAGRARAAEDKLESALDAERSKDERFDDLFDRARKNVRDREERDLSD